MFIIYLDFEDALRMHTAIAYLKKLTALALLMSTHNLSHDQDSSQESRQSSGIIPEPEVVTCGRSATWCRTMLPASALPSLQPCAGPMCSCAATATTTACSLTLL